MAELRPIPIDQLLLRVVKEPAQQGTLFDFPLRKAFRPAAGLDLSVDVHGHVAATPVGPAAGPHAQLAQNIVLAWLGGARIIELKTVQILDELKIGRPCIDAATVGFNVEWSQELKLEDSLREYVVGWMLVRMLRELDPLGLGAEVARAAQPVFELSVGYDLKGLTSPRMREYLSHCQNVADLIEQERARISREHRALADLDYDPHLVRCVTLSTFHGCPADEVEAIAEYLMRDHGVDVIVKLNPTLLGFDEVSYLLHERMGYHELRPKRAAFDSDVSWEQAVAMAQRLSVMASSLGRTFGVKMTNTLVVENHKTFFGDKEMYLSGPPLHVLAMNCVERWRNAFAGSSSASPISFSGGIDQNNFVDAVACDMFPVTTCTDLLRPGGYARLPRYLSNLEEAMRDLGAPDRSELILRRFGHAAEAVRLVFGELRDGDGDDGIFSLGPAAGEAAERLLAELESELLVAAKAKGGQTLGGALASFVARRADGPEARLVERLVDGLHGRLIHAAGVLNTREVTQRATGDPRYAASKNAKPPRKVGSQLVLLDCLSCDKCVPVCPNDANFVLETPAEELACEDVELSLAGEIRRVPGALWKIKESRQWANYADACNECGNCDVFCPENGGPYVMKARFFGSLASFDETPHLDGLVVAAPAGGSGLHVVARVGGRRYTLELDGERAHLDDGWLSAEYDARSGALVGVTRKPGAEPVTTADAHRLPGSVFLTLRALVRGALDSGRLNPVSAAVPFTSGGTCSESNASGR